MLQPTGHRENAVFVEELANLRFSDRCIFYPVIGILRELKWRHTFVAFFLIAFECNRPVPFLLSHRQDLFGRIRIEGDVIEKKNEGITPERRFFWRRWQSVLQISSKIFQRVRRAIGCPSQFLFVESSYRPQRRRHFAQSLPPILERLTRHGPER